MNIRILGLIVVVVIVCASAAVFLFSYSEAPTKHNAKPFDFTLTGTNSCLRYLESNVSLGYVPLTVGQTRTGS